jgi:hypothetical protein
MIISADMEWKSPTIMKPPGGCRKGEKEQYYIAIFRTYRAILLGASVYDYIDDHRRVVALGFNYTCWSGALAKTVAGIFFNSEILKNFWVIQWRCI